MCSAIDDVVSLIQEEKDIRMISAMLPKVSNKFRAVAEMTDTPDNRFTSFLLHLVNQLVATYFEGESKDWYELNKEAISECTAQLKNYLTGLRDALTSKSFEKTIDVIKMFHFAFYQITLLLAT